jgi:hypothetical protein
MSGILANHGIGQSAVYAAFVPREPTGAAGRRKAHPAFGMGDPAARVPARQWTEVVTCRTSLDAPFQLQG